MVLFTTLIVVLALCSIVSVIALAVGGMSIIVAFAEPIAFVAIVALIAKFVIKRLNKR